MNERIRQLAEQAEIYAGELIDEGADYNQYPRFYTEKFAELIVKECAEVCLNPNHWYEDAAGETFNRVIKQHFGVEE